MYTNNNSKNKNNTKQNMNRISYDGRKLLTGKDFAIETYPSP